MCYSESLGNTVQCLDGNCLSSERCFHGTVAGALHTTRSVNNQCMHKMFL